MGDLAGALGSETAVGVTEGTTVTMMTSVGDLEEEEVVVVGREDVEEEIGPSRCRL